MLLGAFALAIVGTPSVQPAHAEQAYPSRPIKIVIPNPPGGDDDTWLALPPRRFQLNSISHYDGR
jgi:tripartite-type tricarboxylate transporter receptor subunit TctC